MYLLSIRQTLVIVLIVQTTSHPIRYKSWDPMKYLVDTEKVLCAPRTCCDTRRQGELIIQATVITNTDCKGSTIIPPITSQVMNSIRTTTVTTTEEPESPIPETSVFTRRIQTTTTGGQTTTTEPESQKPETSVFTRRIQTTTTDGQTTTTEEPESPKPETSVFTRRIQTTTTNGQTTTTEEPESPIPETSVFTRRIQTTTTNGQTSTTEEPESPIPETSVFTRRIQTTTTDGQTTTTEPESPIPETSVFTRRIQTTTTTDGQTTTTEEPESPLPESSVRPSTFITDPYTLPSEGTTTTGYCTPCCDTRRQGQVVIIASVVEKGGADGMVPYSSFSKQVHPTLKNDTMAL